LFWRARLTGAAADPRIESWMRSKGIDAVAWLDSLEGAQRAKAEDYVRRTPAHIDTRYRRLIEQRLGWRPLRDAYVTQRS
jgi:hypothetical protein